MHESLHLDLKILEKAYEELCAKMKETTEKPEYYQESDSLKAKLKGEENGN